MKRSQTTKRRLLAVGAALIALALVVVTWFAATQFQSSAQREASALPPEPQPIMVDIVRTDLTDRTTMKAAAQRTGERKYVLPKPGATSVITAAGVTDGQPLSSGSIVAWVNDRPVFAFKGPFPLYRDLGPGDTGEDVRMVQRALADMGYDIDPDGVFGSVTARYVTDLFRSNGAQAATREKKIEATEQRGVESAQSEGDKQQTQPRPSTRPEQETYLRSSEVLIISDLPGYVVTVPPVGTTLGDENSALVLAASTIQLTSQVPGSIVTRLQPGRQATASVGEQSMALTIASIEDKKAEHNTGDSSAPVTASNSIVTFSSSDKIPPEWVGSNDILITVDLTDPLLDVFVVPQRAIAVDALGVASVLVEQGNELVQVPVKHISCLTGMCAIEAASSTPLSEGQRVRVDR